MRPRTPTPPRLACIALGSNLGDRRAHLAAAFDALGAIAGTTLVKRSSLHETDPIGPPGQGRYLNAAALLQTTLTPRQLLSELLRIEASRGRTRPDPQRWGPRTLDLDLVLFGDAVIDEPGLTIPHPRMHERVFVLAPLAEIAPDLRHPRLGKPIAELLAERTVRGNEPPRPT